MAEPTLYQCTNETCGLVNRELWRRFDGEPKERAYVAYEEYARLTAEVERHLKEIERMAEERHMVHGANVNGFWNCSAGSCKRAAAYLRGEVCSRQALGDKP